MKYDYEEFGELGGFNSKNRGARDFVDPEYLAVELDGCPSKRTMRWMLERMEEDFESDGEGWK